MAAQPISASVFASELVSTVTPSTSGALRPACVAVFCADSSAARIISEPPLVWMVSICTSSRTAEATALATVFGMS